jgi:hypothetical protein
VWNVTIVYSGSVSTANVSPTDAESTELAWRPIDHLPELSPPTEKLFSEPEIAEFLHSI